MPDDFQPKIPVDLHIGLSQRRAITVLGEMFREIHRISRYHIKVYIYISIELIMPVYQSIHSYATILQKSIQDLGVNHCKSTIAQWYYHSSIPYWWNHFWWVTDFGALTHGSNPCAFMEVAWIPVDSYFEWIKLDPDPNVPWVKLSKAILRLCLSILYP